MISLVDHLVSWAWSNEEPQMADNERDLFHARLSAGLIGSTIAISAIAVTALTCRKAVPICIGGGAVILTIGEELWARVRRGYT